jgi:hypothetical protein
MMDLGMVGNNTRVVFSVVGRDKPSLCATNHHYGNQQTLVMAQHYTQVEVLLMTGTNFVAGDWISKGEDPAGRRLSESEKLQEVCWNGLLETMLPEVWIKPANDSVLYLWGIKEARAFLELELSEVPLPIDKRLSITPHSFLAFQEYN